MTTIANKSFQPMLRLSSMRKVHLPGTPGIYNSKVNWKPGPNWQPQSPLGPWLDGWALGFSTAIRPAKPYLFYSKFALICAVSFWYPFFIVEFQMRKTSQ